jgi:hypothetical protein
MTEAESLQIENAHLREMLKKAGDLLQEQQEALAPILGPGGDKAIDHLLRAGGMLEKCDALLAKLECVNGYCPSCGWPERKHKSCELEGIRTELKELLA